MSRAVASARVAWKRMAVLAGGVVVAAASLGAAQAPDNLAVLDQVWGEARAYVHPASLVDSHFTAQARRELEAAARAAPDVYAFAPSINAFLATLGRSHTGFYTDRDLDFYLYRSMFTSRDPGVPPVYHVGLQHWRRNGAWVVREVWDGLPAHRAGLRRGDVVLSANGRPYHPFLAFNPEGRPAELEVRRLDRTLSLTVTPVRQNPNQSLFEAMGHSERMITRGDLRIGYIHLWSGVHREAAAGFVAGIERLRGADAMVVDLRGGFGGAWYEFLDPFYPSRDGYFSYTIVDREGEHPGPRGERTDVVYYDGPLVVLINEGTRSGKESLAYQFRQGDRATVVGTTTAGAFTAGRGLLTDPALPYFLFLASAEPRLDGRIIEGVGVAPHVTVAYQVTGDGTDPQLERALEIAVAAAAG